MTKRLLILLSAVLLPVYVVAQPATGGVAAKTLVAPANLTFGASPGTEKGVTGGQLILDVSTKGKEGTAAFGWGRPQRQVQIAFTAPLDSNDEALPISLTGLDTGAKAKFSFNRLNWRGPNPLEGSQINDLCKRLNLADGRLPFDEAKKLPACNASAIENEDDRRLFRYLSHVDDIPWTFGGDVTAGQVTRKFLHADSLEADAIKDITWSASARVGAFKPSLGFVLFAYSYGETLKAAGDPVDICRPVVGATVAGAASCQSSVVGAPVPKTTSVTTLELRNVLSGRVAWSPSIEYDFKRDASGNRTVAVQVPVYFLSTNGTASPTGGIRFGWRSDTREVTAVVFFGGAFSMF